MPTFVYIGDGVTTTYRFPGEPVSTTYRIDGVMVDPVASSPTHVQFRSVAPSGSVVEVIQKPVSQSGEPGWSLPATLQEAPLALTGGKHRFTPVVRFVGAGADRVPFTVNPQAMTMEVSSGGTVTETY